MSICHVTTTDPLWPALVEHLTRTGDAKWVLPDGSTPRPGLYILGATAGEIVVGNLSLVLQDIVSPQTAWSDRGGYERTLRAADGTPYRETFVETFTVEEAYRRRGIGRALQQAALDLSRGLGACQMRSWSSLDRPANHALKISLGFAVHPAVQHAARTGEAISGVYFVKVVQPAGR